MTAYIIDAARTPRGRGKKDKGALSGIHPQELLAQTLEALAAKAGIERGDVDDVVVGCVTQAKEQGACIARNSILAAGWPDDVTGVTLNRFCGSGLQAVNFAAMGVLSGQQDLVVGGGVESMSRVPMGADEAGIDGHNLHLRKRVAQVPQGISADLIATREGFTRADVDAFAAESQKRAAAAIEGGWFDGALFPVKDPASGEVVLEKDEHPRPGTTVESLGELKPAFVKMGAMPVGPNGETLDQIALARYPDVKAIEHVHTAGNSSGIVDGAAAVLLASEAYVKAKGLKPRAKIRATATAGAEPVIMLTAPTPASKRALAKAGMKASDIDLWEINEAFATVPLQTMRNLEIDHAKVNVAGGAIALGHPLGATGAMLLQTAVDELERRDLQTALITLCIGGGMGIATVIERV
ncbi:MAG TPA: acetyl-CoA C-acetyltransferase [Polyangiaceae bacterium LLY-WYZ-15_(1-7)]|nr:acetyl-CoA acetyltransferase [Sandaracinus sp.]HJL04834.1 acetyl-CoA C-acetyltransferase [Polyangiaceae bacterium LLY-WYZ-15_(1-7)]MBJ70144.1 acetyl-CoA acetyltransferase [Sandaracinus sp.]MBJ72479.1 acetyl-CoA acetyltransferase [Sandaracinus sp.]HJL09923.1 acetyl-CoA C-acetyltransferase [Polyangiaceae bacterium LLY-WYZ-15_(1-7)]